MSAIGRKRTCVAALHVSAFDPKRTWAFVIPAPFRALAEIATITYRSLGTTMRRRDLLKVFAGGVTIWPLAVHAQKTVPVIGYLSGRSPTSRRLANAFFKGAGAAGSWSAVMS